MIGVNEKEGDVCLQQLQDCLGPDHEDGGRDENHEDYEDDHDDEHDDDGDREEEETDDNSDGDEKDWMKRIQRHLFTAISIFFRINVPELGKDGDGDDGGVILINVPTHPNFT